MKTQKLQYYQQSRKNAVLTVITSYRFYVSLMLGVCLSSHGPQNEVVEEIKCKPLISQPKSCKNDELMPSNPLPKCDALDEKSQMKFCDVPFYPHSNWPLVHMPLSIGFDNITPIEGISTGVSDCIREASFFTVVSVIILTLTVTSLAVCVMTRGGNGNDNGFSQEDTDKDPVIGELVYITYTSGVNVGCIDDRSLPVFLSANFNDEINHLRMDHEGNMIFQRPLHL